MLENLWPTGAPSDTRSPLWLRWSTRPIPTLTPAQCNSVPAGDIHAVPPDGYILKSWQGCLIAMLTHRGSTNVTGNCAAEASNARRCKSFLFDTAMITITTLVMNCEQPHQCRGPFKAFISGRCTVAGGKPLFCFPPLACLPACSKAVPQHCRPAVRGPPRLHRFPFLGVDRSTSAVCARNQRCRPSAMTPSKFPGLHCSTHAAVRVQPWAPHRNLRAASTPELKGPLSPVMAGTPPRTSVPVKGGWACRGPPQHFTPMHTRGRPAAAIACHHGRHHSSWQPSSPAWLG